MECPDCKIDMKKTRIEWLCPRCGRVGELIDLVNICDFQQYGHGTPVHLWKANIPQTMQMYYWRGGRMVLTIKNKRYGARRR